MEGRTQSVCIGEFGITKNILPENRENIKKLVFISGTLP